MKQNLSVFEFCECAAEQLVSKKPPRSQRCFLFYFFSFTHHPQRQTSHWVEQKSMARLSLEPTPQKEILAGVPRRDQRTFLGARVSNTRLQGVLGARGVPAHGRGVGTHRNYSVIFFLGGEAACRLSSPNLRGAHSTLNWFTFRFSIIRAEPP